MLPYVLRSLLLVDQKGFSIDHNIVIFHFNILYPVLTMPTENDKTKVYLLLENEDQLLSNLNISWLPVLLFLSDIYSS